MRSPERIEERCIWAGRVHPMFWVVAFGAAGTYLAVTGGTTWVAWAYCRRRRRDPAGEARTRQNVAKELR